jgi:hypothetical protein
VLLFDRPLTEPGYGAEPTVTPARAGPLVPSSPGEAIDVGAAGENKASEWARHQLVNSRRPGEEASRVSPRYQLETPASASRSGSAKAGWIVTSAADEAAVITGPRRLR